MFWKIFKDYFKLPKIILTLLISLILFTLIQLTKQKLIFVYAILIILSIIPLIFTFYNQFQLKRKYKNTGKKWLFEKNIGILGGYLFIGIQIPNLVYNLFKIHDISTNVGALLIISFALSLFGIFNCILIKVLPVKIEESMSRDFPDYNLYQKA